MSRPSWVELDRLSEWDFQADRARRGARALAHVGVAIHMMLLGEAARQLDLFAEHDIGCEVSREGIGRDCDCGFDDAFDLWSKLLRSRNEGVVP